MPQASNKHLKHQFALQTYIQNSETPSQQSKLASQHI